MTSDARLYARLALDFDENPKIAPLSDRAFRELIEALLWSRRVMTDGRIPAAMIARKFTPEALAELTSNGSPASLVYDGDDVLIHDYAEHQVTRADVARLSAAGRKGALARHSANSASTSGDAKPSANRMRIASESSSQKEKEKEKRTTGPRKRGTRITENFVVDDALRDYAKSKAPAADIERERENFINYWLASSGKNAVKIDWRRAFMSWLNNAQRFAEERGWQPSAATNKQPTNESQQRMLTWLDARGITLDEWESRKHDSAWVESLRGVSA